MLIINFKTYRESTGSTALDLAKALDAVCKNAPTDVFIAVQALDIEKIASHVRNIGVMAQHVDGFGYGAHTGAVLVEELADRGAIGTLINHSEHQLSDQCLSTSLDMSAQKWPETTVVCVDSYEKALDIERRFDPRKIAFEPTELIGGEISVSTAQPDIIQKVVNISHEKQILVGAGVKNREDIQTSLRLGAVGVLVASGVVKAQDPPAVLEDFLSAWA